MYILHLNDVYEITPDALDASVCTQPTNLTRLITRVMGQAVADAQLVVFSGIQ